MFIVAKSPIIAIGLIAVIITGVAAASSTVLTYNSLVSKQATVQAQWAQVENQYQRKIDLIPQLVNATGHYMQFEQSTLQNITRLRTQWMSASGVDQRVNITNAIDVLLFRMTATYENYPVLHSDILVAGLMDELAGTENRIAVERMRFNDDVLNYNTQVRTFPSNVVAGWFGFHETQYYTIPGHPQPYVITGRLPVNKRILIL